MFFCRSFPLSIKDKIFRPLPKATPLATHPDYHPISSYPHFTPRCTFPLVEQPHYVPSHEARAMQRLPRVAQTADGVLEVRDARAPFTTAVSVQNLEKTKLNRIVLLNKADLITPEMTNKIKKIFEKNKIACLGTSAFFGKNISKVKNLVIEQMPVKFGSLGVRIAVIGLPNMGKSSLIEALKQDTMKNVNLQCIDVKLSKKIHNKVKMNKLPGTTREFGEFVINHKPLIKVIDSPGVTFLKNADDVERNVKLAVLGVYPDHIYGERNIADYVLWRLNVRKEFGYVEFFELTEPTDAVDELLMHIARLLAQGNGGQLDTLTAARCFIRHFREGKLGKICLDHVPDQEQMEAWEEWVVEPPSPWGPETYAGAGEVDKWRSFL